jgi:OOP family OmpA-OmpF porin
MAGSVHGATAEVAGRDIRVSGLADGPEEAASLIAALDALPGRRVITSDLTILEKAAPFTLDVAKDGTAMTASGHVPTETLRAELAGVLGDAAGGLKLAAGAPEGWADLAKAGLAALGPLGKGTMNLVRQPAQMRQPQLTPPWPPCQQAA